MKVYKFNGTDEVFEDEEIAIDYLMQTIGFNFDDTLDTEQMEMQAELRSILLETYFHKAKLEENEETEFDYYFDKGFHPDILAGSEV